MRRLALASVAALVFGVVYLMLGLVVYTGGKLYLAGHNAEPPWYDSAAAVVVIGGAIFSAAVIFAVCWRLTSRPQPGGGASE